MDGAKVQRKRGTQARHVDQPPNSPPEVVFWHWLRATPALDRIEWVDVRFRPDGEPRRFGELKHGSQYTGLVRVIDRKDYIWGAML